VKRKFSIIVLFLIMAVFLAPFLLLLFASFFDGNPLKNGFEDVSFTLSQYVSAFQDPLLMEKFLNSVKISLYSLFIQMPASIMLGYALTVINGRWAFFIKGTLIVALLLPFESIMVPVFKMSKWAHLYDKQISVVLLQAFSPMAAIFISLLITSVDSDLVKAASLDTNSSFLIFTKIILPLILPGLSVCALICFLESWNLTEPALILLPDEHLRPASIAINDLSERSENASIAASVLYSLPVIFLYLPLSKVIIRKESIF